ncbi:MAG: glycogen debranching enzyme family protein [Elusimicrobia bacterium]|nr:glycogen debranching enzyme family protein [Elusimicrobiota bacterium]
MPPKGTPLLLLGPDICRNFEDASGREWIETNGRGSYAMGAVADCATRRYHGFLTVARRPPLDRFQLVNRLEETVFQDGTRVDLSCQQYPGVSRPASGDRLESFRLDPFPTWTFAWGETRLQKTYFLRYGEDTGVMTYRLLSGPALEMEVRPLLSFRDHHSLGRRDARFEGRLSYGENLVGVSVPGVDPLTLWATDGHFYSVPVWYNTQDYVKEERRGEEGWEDVFGPGIFRFSLQKDKPVSVVFSAVLKERVPSSGWEGEERDQRRKIVQGSLVRGPLGGALSAAADSFVVSRGEGLSVLAGYPWLADWSRDALVAFPGLFLATGRWSEATSFLETYARHVRQGLLPNYFSEGNASVAYNAVDAPLWFIRAVQAYHKATHDDAAVRKWLPILRDIVDAFQNGAAYDIHMDGDGLIVAPAADLALTWMDARVNGQRVTPRTGKPVEIQALWYNALQFLVEIQLKLKEPTRGYDTLAQIARQSFNAKFWNESGAYLYDVIEGKQRDDAVRPNALLAVSLPYEILEEKRFRSVVDAAWKTLYTPRGMRTLAPGSPGYRARCEGTLSDRDSAYHQGTVWPWLLGPFLTAFVKAYGATEETKSHVVSFLQPFLGHLTEVGVGHISEIFDGDAPHSPRGCPAQAWNVGELLRVMWEEGVTL